MNGAWSFCTSEHSQMDSYHGNVCGRFAFLCVHIVYLPFCASGIKLCTPECPVVLAWLCLQDLKVAM